MSHPTPETATETAPAALTAPPASRRHMLKKLGYVAPAVIMLEVARSERALGFSGPGNGKAKGKGKK